MTAQAGCGLIFLPLVALAIVGLWDGTRHWTPLYWRVSLAEGLLRTPEFEINLNGTYSVGLGVEYNLNVGTGPCARFGECYDDLSKARASWRLFREGQVVASGMGAADGDAAIYDSSVVARPWGRFNAKPGRYVLEVQVLHDVSSLDAASPRLIVWESGGAKSRSDARMGNASLACWFMNPIGVALLILAAVNRREEARSTFLAAHPFTEPGSQCASLPFPRRPLVFPKPYGPRSQTGVNGPLYPRLSTVSLVTLLALLVVAIPVWTDYMMRPGTVGLPVRLYDYGPMVRPIIAGIQPLRVRVDADRDLYVNWQPVAREDFVAVLRRELRRRPLH